MDPSVPRRLYRVPDVTPTRISGIPSPFTSAIVWPPWRYVGRDRDQAVVPFEAERASSTPLLLTSPVTTSGKPSPFTSPKAMLPSRNEPPGTFAAQSCVPSRPNACMFLSSPSTRISGAPLPSTSAIVAVYPATGTEYDRRNVPLRPSIAAMFLELLPTSASKTASPFTSTRVGVVKRTLALLYVHTIEPVLLRRTTLCPGATRVRHFRFPFSSRQYTYPSVPPNTMSSRPSLSRSAIVAPEAPPPVGPYVHRGPALHAPVRYAGTDVPFVLYTTSYVRDSYAPTVASKNTCALEICPPVYA